MKGELTLQNYDSYDKEDFKTWETLYVKQCENLKKDDKVVKEFWTGLNKLKIKKSEIPDFDKINKILKKENNFEIVGVTGIVDDGIFFNILKNRKFPVTTWIRKPSEIDYIEQPDMFHDLFGHVPFLINPTYTNFLMKLADVACEVFTTKDKELQHKFSRIYWYTIEFGLILNKENRHQIYGAGIISSYAESIKALSHESVKRDFSKELLLERFEKDHLQDFYAVIPKNLESGLEIAKEVI